MLEASLILGRNPNGIVSAFLCAAAATQIWTIHNNIDWGECGVEEWGIKQTLKMYEVFGQNSAAMTI